MTVAQALHVVHPDKAMAGREVLSLGVVVGATVTFMVMARVPVSLAALAAIWFVAFSVPGIWLARALFQTPGHSLLLSVVGAAAGQVLGRLCLLGAAGVAGPRAGALVTVAAGVLLTAAVATSVWKRSWFDEEDRHDLRAACWISSAVIMVAAVVYAFVGRSTASGVVFIPYFNLDYLQHSSIAAELSRSVPPGNPFFAGAPLHYYWFYHVYPAALAALTGAPARYAVASTVPFLALHFIAVLVLLPRGWAAAPARHTAVAVALFAPSFVGVLALLQAVLPQALLPLPSVNSVSAYSFLSHSWFRDVLYEPHALTALTWMACSCLLVCQTGRVTGRVAAALAGLLSGAALLSDGFVGALAVAWGPVWILWGARWNRLPLALLACYLVPVCLWATLGVVLEVIPTGGHSVILSLHPAAKYAPLYLAVETGVLGLLGASGLILALRRRRDWPVEAWPLVALMIFCLIIAFGVIVPNDPNTALRKAIKVLQFPLCVFAAVAVAWAWREPRRRLAVGIWMTLAVLSAITSFTDVWQYTAGGLTKPGSTYMSASQMSALDWVRRCTPATAVFQDIAQVRPERRLNDNADLLIPALGERRALWANYHHPYVLRVDEDQLEYRRSALERMFQSANAEELERVVKDLRPDYLYVDRQQPGPHLALSELTERGKTGTPRCFGPVCLVPLASVTTSGNTSCPNGS